MNKVSSIISKPRCLLFLIMSLVACEPFQANKFLQEKLQEYNDYSMKELGSTAKIGWKVNQGVFEELSVRYPSVLIQDLTIEEITTKTKLIAGKVFTERPKRILITLQVPNDPFSQFKYGPILASGLGRVQNDNHVAGYVLAPTKTRILKSESEFKAIKGVHFGISFKISKEEYSNSEMRVVIKFPHGGLTNPSTGENQAYVEFIRPVNLGENKKYGYKLEEPWEIVDGDWVFLIYLDGYLVKKQTFHLTK